MHANFLRAQKLRDHLRVMSRSTAYSSTILFVAIAGVSLLFPQGYRLPDLAVAVPHALPTVGDILGPGGGQAAQRNSHPGEHHQREKRRPVHRSHP